MRTRLFKIAVALGAAALASASRAAASQAPQGDATAGAAMADPSQAGDIGFMGARLGMGLAAWKALAYPGRNPGDVAAACAAGRASAGGLVCTYAQRAGGLSLPLSIPLSGSWLVRDPQYDFVGGRLSRIEFHTSIDAFNALTARFEARYGPASQTLHDDVTTRGGLDLPRVRMIWRLPAGSIEIVDPTTPPNQLAVRFAGP
ncbi:MAG TPA: hypothetical protein VHZ26_03620 [Caulobacteraceae bacterium]|jgi:hypothetical protein|nr:hypothetical protein [Caulobacteraceae bacterium]